MVSFSVLLFPLHAYACRMDHMTMLVTLHNFDLADELFLNNNKQ